MTYDEWKRRRLECVPGRCGGRPTIVDSRLEPWHIGGRVIAGDTVSSVAEDYGYCLTVEDVVYMTAYYVEDGMRNRGQEP